MVEAFVEYLAALFGADAEIEVSASGTFVVDYMIEKSRQSTGCTSFIRCCNVLRMGNGAGKEHESSCHHAAGGIAG